VSGDVVKCPRESQALHSDYYRAAKKSAFPLNEACIDRDSYQFLCVHACVRVQTHRIGARFRCRARDFSSIFTNTDEIRVSLLPRKQRDACDVPDRQRIRACDSAPHRQFRRSFTIRKIFLDCFAKMQFQHSTPTRIERIAWQSDSRRD
jgi:hypothetical protein